MLCFSLCHCELLIQVLNCLYRYWSAYTGTEVSKTRHGEILCQQCCAQCYFENRIVDYFDMTIGRINQRNVKQQIDRVPLHPVKTVKTTKTRMAASCRRGQTMQLQSIASRKQWNVSLRQHTESWQERERKGRFLTAHRQKNRPFSTIPAKNRIKWDNQVN